jgi:4-hydroxy-tetrahydrodipicolinate reductase
VKYALVGYGRMGREVDAVALERGHERVAILGSGGSGSAADRDLASLEGAELAFEFTRPEAAEANVVRLLRAGLDVVSGTTGWVPGPLVAAAARDGHAGAVLAPNFSVGVVLFCRIVEHAARILSAAGLYEPYVLEAHHRHKRDAPSGTARHLASILLDADPRLDAAPTREASGLPLEVVSLRAGHEPGRHTVGFDGEHDGITLTHRARGRGGFAAGAVLAAEWIRGRRGVHAFEAVLEQLLARQGATGETTGQGR